MQNIKWHEVTWYSKWGAIILFLVVVPILAFIVGVKFQEVKDIQSRIIFPTGYSVPKAQDLGMISFSSVSSSTVSSNIEFKIVTAHLSFTKDKNIENKINAVIDQELRNIKVVYEDSVGQIPCANLGMGECKSAVELVATTSISKRFSAVSVEFDVFVASEGMAHPDYQREKTIHFDLNTGDQKNYFEILGGDKVNLLNRISDLSRRRLSAALNINQNSAGADTFEKGTAPLEENFKHVLLGENGLTVGFVEYQVGPRPLGAPQVFIDYKDIF